MQILTYTERRVRTVDSPKL